MFKVLLTILMAVSAMLSGNPNPEELQKKISGGIAYPSSNRAHSFYYKSIPCDKKDKWIENYKKLEEQGAFLPQTFKDFEATSDQKDCYIFFKNLFVLDLKIYHNVSLLIESFKRFVEALGKSQIYGYLTIKPESFVYEPSTRRYVFIDLDLETEIEVDENKLQSLIKNKNMNDIKLRIVEIFLRSLSKQNIFLTENQFTDFKNLGGRDNYGFMLVRRYELDLLTVVQDINSYGKKAFSLPLTIDIKENENHFDLKVSHEGKVTTFDHIRKEDSFAIYLCRKGKEPSSTECSIVDEKDKLNGTYKYYVRDDLRIDIEVQESYTQENDWDKNGKKRTFYEIFIITKLKDALGMTRSQTYIGSSSSLEIKDNDLVLCETTSNKLLTLYTENKNKHIRSFSIYYNHRRITSSSEIIQISPSHLKDIFSLGNYQVKRMFFVSQAVNRTIFIVDNSNDFITMIFIEKFEVGLSPLYYKNCKISSSGVSFSADLNNKELEYKSETRTYPSPIVFMKKYDTNKLTNFCFKEQSGDKVILNVDSSSNNYFCWDFNTYAIEDGKKMDKSFLRYSENLENCNSYSVKPEFRKFAWPIAQPDVVYISIVYDNNYSYSKVKDYYVRAFFFKADGSLFSLLTDEQTDNNQKQTIIHLNQLPENFICLSKNIYKTFAKEYFKNLDAVYRSEIEIVYQVQIPEFQNCNPYLSLYNKTIIEIWCDSSEKYNKNPIPYNSKYLSSGFSKIIDQARPIVSNESKDLIDPNNKQDKVARVLV